MRLRFLRRALICGAVAFVGMLAAPAEPASAAICVQAGVSIDGTEPGYTGVCQPWFTPVLCIEGGAAWENLYVKENVCIPTW